MILKSFWKLIFVLSAFGSWNVQAQVSIQRTAEDLVRTLAALREQVAPTEVKIEMATKKRLVDYVRKRVKEKMQPEQLLLDRWSLVAFRMLQTPMNPSEMLEKFSQDQVAGFYDPQGKVMFVADWIPNQLLLPVLAHELTHFLQDHLTGLDEFIRMDVDRTGPIPVLPYESSLARHALVEGEAVLMMALYLDRETAKAPTLVGTPTHYAESDDVSFFLPNLDVEIKKMSQRFALPPEVIEATFFSYVQGYRFVRQLKKRGGFELIRWAFSCPPVDTQEILNPARYLSRIQIGNRRECRAGQPTLASKLKFNSLAQLGNVKLLRSEVGMMSVELLWKFHESVATKPLPAPPGWLSRMTADTALFAIRETKTGGEAGVVWESEWADAHAAEVAELWWAATTQRVLGKKVKPLNETRRPSGLHAGWMDRGRRLYGISRKGARLTVGWNLPPELQPDFLRAVAVVQPTRVH